MDYTEFNPLEVEAKCSSASKVVLSCEENPFSATVFCRCRTCFLLIESVVWRTTEQFFTTLCGSITCASVPQAIIQFKSLGSVLLIFVMHALYVLFVKFNMIAMNKNMSLFVLL